MGERQDYIALDWVAGEIEDTLKQASQALEAYIANRNDATKLRFCLTHIHQVHGTLQMVEFFGAALLAQEMEGMAHALAQGKIHDSHVDDALAVLKNAIAQLPKYLEKVKASRHGLPATLLPLLNDLRAVRGESLLSETALFSPNLAASQQASTGEAIIKGTELAELVHKLRQMYQVALLGLIRGKDTRENLNYLAKVCARLAKVSAGCSSQVLWRVCIAVLEGMLNGSIEAGVAVKILLRQVDRQIKLIVEQGEAALAKPVPEGLLKNLLYYVARSKANSKFIKEIKAEFNLEESLLGDGELSDESLAKPDSNVMRSVVEALSRELAEIRQHLQEAGTEASALADTLPLFKRISDTMAILGLGQTLKLLQDPHTQLARLLSMQQPISPKDISAIDSQLAAAAQQLNPGAMIQPEQDQALFNDSEEAQEQLDSALTSVLKESRIGLEQAKEAIIEFVATQWNHACLADVPELLKEIRGSLNMVPLPEASKVIAACESYVNEVLLTGQQVPEWQMLDTLADAITSIDYYLERMIDDPNSDVEAVLDVAAESVAELGYPIDDRQPRVKSVPEAPTGNFAAEEGGITGQPLEPATPEPSSTNVIPLYGATSDQAEGEQGEPGEPIIDEAAEPTLETDLAPQADAEPEAFEMVEEPVQTGEPAVAVEETPLEDDGEYDPEIVEIFIEEAGEVLETINEYLPQWLADKDNDEARTEVRRAYHTLKGSGRMVGATDIGELAWSVENMLNRVLDNTFAMDDARFALVQEVTAKVPDLVSAFERRVMVDKSSFEPLMARAELLSKEQSPALEGVAPAAPEEAPAAAAPEVADTATVEEDDLIDIFAAEATVHSEALRHYIQYCKELAGPAELTDDLQRALHTLKGSANMAGISPVADVVTEVEHFVRELRASQIKADEPIVTLLDQGYSLIRQGIDQLQASPMQALDGVDAYGAGLRAVLEERLSQVVGQVGEEAGIAPDAINLYLSDSLDCINKVDEKLKAVKAGQSTVDVLASCEEPLEQLVARSEAVNMVPLAELADALEVLYRHASRADHGAISDRFFELASAANDAIVDMLDQIAGHQTPQFEPQLLTDIQDFEFTAVPIVDEIDIQVPGTGDSGWEQPQPEGGLAWEQESEQEAYDLSGLPSGQDFNAIPEDASPAETIDDESLTSVMAEFAEVVSGQPEAEIELDAAEEQAEDYPTLGSAPQDTDDAIAFNFESTAGDSGAEEIPTMEFDSVAEQPPEPEAVYEPPVEEVEPAAIESTPQPVAAADESDDDIDEEIIAIFLEEADDLLEGIDEAIHGWTDERDNRAHLDDLLRILHTLKGGARLAGLTQMGNLSHNFETSLIGFDGSGAAVTDDLLAEVQDYQDRLLAQLNAIKAGEKLAEVAPLDEPDAGTEPPPVEQAAPVEHVVNDVQPTEESFELDLDDEMPGAPAAPSGVEPSKAPAEVVPLATKAKQVSTDQAAPPAFDLGAKKGPQEVVKVSAQLLEDLVNLAGETSISRGRAEEQITELVFALEEMQITVDRLQEQVRRLDMETEAQILYRQEQVESEGMEGFDPLEMDRYSQLQQLSRSLLESSSDLTDIKNTLSDKSRDMEQLLVQQSRINTELQEGLMRSRMVPFSRMVPRLRRIVRQVSGELNKKVDFHLQNVEGELDRTVLERMVAPLEHMLRNAVDHGIEKSDVREAAGKSPRGSVTLALGREGGEIVLTLSDDGGGIDLNAVRKKAIERGLMEPNAELSDHEVLQFILQAGFSTASQVTQISGRGVGMDVVHSEIKQLGGTMDIDSEYGQGSIFTVRLPFTVSVNRALMVSVSGDSYAIPLNTIEGIVRVSPFELEAYYQPDAPLFEYAGQPYLLRYMGALLHRGEKPILEGQSTPLPVILVRGAEHSVAVQVDALMGSREIVVKPLGPQFSMVHGLSGATVLGDGSVVVILDLLAMIRADASHLHRDHLLGQDNRAEEDQNILVMVVDDSVTVRKVTSRFLERQGMEVITAKDGVDAVTQLQEIERLPNVMLLDIEMPRMDGFEVASRVKHSSRLKDIPIIMITSRTGEKHRERALSIGVEEYMGKPYQESKLLETINTLLGVTV